MIADEPTTALDVTIQAQILKLLRRLATERGVSVLFATHDLGTAWEICDRVTVMYAGQELETAPIADFFRAPMVPYTRLLLDSLPIERFAAARHSRRRAEPDRAAERLPLPSALSARRAMHAATQHPAAREPEPGHQVRCHHPHLQPVVAA